MSINIADVLRDRYLIPFNITREQVEETIIDEDVRKTMNFGDLVVILLLKKFDNYYIFVDARSNLTFSQINVASAFKIDQQLIGGVSIDNPITVLKQLANNFGADVSIGGQTSKFIHDAQVEFPKENRTNSEIESEVFRRIAFSENGVPIIVIGGNYVGDSLVGHRELGDKVHVDVVLAYQINADRYRRYLQSNNLL
jgi:hypothetical protein